MNFQEIKLLYIKCSVCFHWFFPVTMIIIVISYLFVVDVLKKQKYDVQNQTVRGNEL